MKPLSQSFTARAGRWAFSRSEICGRCFRDMWRESLAFDLLVTASVVTWGIVILRYFGVCK